MSHHSAARPLVSVQLPQYSLHAHSSSYLGNIAECCLLAQLQQEAFVRANCQAFQAEYKNQKPLRQCRAL